MGRQLHPHAGNMKHRRRDSRQSRRHNAGNCPALMSGCIACSCTVRSRPGSREPAQRRQSERRMDLIRRQNHHMKRTIGLVVLDRGCSVASNRHRSRLIFGRRRKQAGHCPDPARRRHDSPRGRCGDVLSVFQPCWRMSKAQTVGMGADDAAHAESSCRG